MSAILSVLLWGVAVIVGLIALYAAFMIAGTLITLVLGNKPAGLEVDVDVPPSCRVGDEVELTVQVRNTLERDRTLTSVDISAAYLAGLVVRRIEPAPITQSARPMLNRFIHPMDRPLSANGVQTVRFVLHAAKEGDFGGDITVYVDGGNFRYISKTVRTIVHGA